MKSERGKQNLIVISFLIMIAGVLLMIGDKGAGIPFFFGIALFMMSFVGWITAMMWKIAVGTDDFLEKNL